MMRVIKRLRALWRVLRMPADGLDETLKTLVEIETFYRERAAYMADDEPVWSYKEPQDIRIVRDEWQEPIKRLWDNMDEYDE